MRVACIMMERNENLLLENWVHYHGSLFGYENLYIFDDGSDHDVVVRLLPLLREQYGVNIEVLSGDRSLLEKKGDIILQKITELEASTDYDFFMPLDCDEFICVQNGNRVFFSKEAIVPELEKHRSSPNALKIAGCFYNFYGKKNHYYYLDVPKTFFAAGAAGYLDVGFHDGRSRLSLEDEPTAIQLMHLHNKPFETLKVHAASKLQTRVASMDAADLKAYRGPGQHLIKYFFMSDDDYLRSLPAGREIYIPEFSDMFEQIGYPLTF
jgi:hypothetical protein